MLIVCQEGAGTAENDQGMFSTEHCLMLFSSLDLVQDMFAAICQMLLLWKSLGHKVMPYPAECYVTHVKTGYNLLLQEAFSNENLVKKFQDFTPESDTEVWRFFVH